MAAAFGWGAVGGAALLIGALIACLLQPSRTVIAVVMALGTGLLIGSVSFELVEEALETRTVAWVALLVLVGAAFFTIGDWCEAAVLRLFPPAAQERIGWAWDQAIVQTGGYFYSRMILMLINGAGFLITMVAVGLPAPSRSPWRSSRASCRCSSRPSAPTSVRPSRS